MLCDLSWYGTSAHEKTTLQISLQAEISKVRTADESHLSVNNKHLGVQRRSSWTGRAGPREVPGTDSRKRIGTPIELGIVDLPLEESRYFNSTLCCIRKSGSDLDTGEAWRSRRERCPVWLRQ